MFLQYCNQTFQIPQHISHPVDVLQLHSTYTTVVSWQPLHPVNRFYCFQETFENLPAFPPFSGTATAGAVPWLQSASKPSGLQDLEASRQNSCDHDASQNNAWFHRNLRISCEKRHHSMYIEAKVTASSINFKVYQPRS